MTTTPALDQRSQEVLKSLIRLHVATGEAIGSETLAREMNRSLSPATIRNIMADLERQGYLDHPHTSAGRVPTDEGYRVFVDSLLARTVPQPLAPREAAAIASGLRPGEGSSEQLLENASHLLSRLTRNVAFVLVPELARTSLRHVDLVRLPHPRILVVMVAWTGLATHRIIEVEEEISQDELVACANYLNANFAGMSLASIRSRLLELMRQEKALYDSLLKKVITVGKRAFAGQDEAGSVYLDGTSHILDQSEFEDLGRMRTLFKTFEEKGRLVKILNAYLSEDGLRIYIGHENLDPDLKTLALVTAAYPAERGARWGLGVMGSTRMEYGRVIALVDHVSRTVSRVLSELSA